MPNKARPVHFRVVKHGIQTGEVLAVMLDDETRPDADGNVTLPTFAEMTGKGYAPLTWIRHHTRRATPEEYDRLAGIMKKHLGPVTPYEKLTDRFRL